MWWSNFPHSPWRLFRQETLLTWINQMSQSLWRSATLLTLFLKTHIQRNFRTKNYIRNLELFPVYLRIYNKCQLRILAFLHTLWILWACIPFMMYEKLAHKKYLRNKTSLLWIRCFHQRSLVSTKVYFWSITSMKISVCMKSWTEYFLDG